MVNERSGPYLKDMCSSKKFTLCIMEITKRSTNISIKSVICTIWPRKKYIRFRNVLYIWEKVRHILPLLGDNSDYTSFSEYFNNCILLDGRDDEIELDYDLANELAKDLWLDLLRDNTDYPYPILKFSQYMKLISTNAKSFVYEFALDDKVKVNGVVWQTATMRASFEISGSYIYLNTLNREINKWIWTYMSVSLYNEHRKTCLACEGIECGVWRNAY